MLFSVIALIFLAASLTVNLLELVAYVFIRPFSLSAFRRVNSQLCYLYWCIIPWLIDSWSRLEMRVYAADEEVRTIHLANMIAILNHRGDVDWMLGYSLCDRFGNLQNVKCLMKSFVKYLPTLGWSFWFSDYAFLKRSYEQDHAHLTAITKQWTSYQFPWALCLFAEGTRFTEEKHRKSLEYASKKGLPQLKHLLLPRTKGFNVMIHQLKDCVPYIYNITFAFPHGVITLADVIQGRKIHVDVSLKRVPVSDVPMESEEATSAWLMNLFKEKDDLIDYHCQHGRFPGPLVDQPSRLYPTIIMTLWTSLFLTLLLCYIYSLLIAGEFWKLAILGTLLLGAHFGMRLLMTVSQIPQGSQQPVKKGD